MWLNIKASILTGTTQHLIVDGVLMSESILPQPKSGISKDIDRNPIRVDIYFGEKALISAPFCFSVVFL